MKNIVILISGGGSNMAAIVKTAQRDAWHDKFGARVAAVISNKASAAGLIFAAEHGLATEVLDHKAFDSREAFDAALARVTAPIAGTILKIYARPGDQVGADGLLDLADLSRLDVVADVYETDLARLRVGAPAEVLVPGEAQRFPATVREIGWQVRRTTQAGTDPVAAVDARTVEVRLSLDEAGRAALERRSNMQVQVAIRP